MVHPFGSRSPASFDPWESLVQGQLRLRALRPAGRRLVSETRFTARRALLRGARTRLLVRVSEVSPALVRGSVRDAERPPIQRCRAPFCRHTPRRWLRRASDASVSAAVRDRYGLGGALCTRA